MTSRLTAKASAPGRRRMHERKRAERALDALSFFVSDARYGLGAYLGVYLIPLTTASH